MLTSGLCGQKPFTVSEDSTLTVGGEPQEAKKVAKRAGGARVLSPPRFFLFGPAAAQLLEI